MSISFSSICYILFLLSSVLCGFMLYAHSIYGIIFEHFPSIFGCVITMYVGKAHMNYSFKLNSISSIISVIIRVTSTSD